MATNTQVNIQAGNVTANIKVKETTSNDIRRQIVNHLDNKFDMDISDLVEDWFNESLSDGLPEETVDGIKDSFWDDLWPQIRLELKDYLYQLPDSSEDAEDIDDENDGSDF